MPKKSKRLVKSNTRFSITQMKNFLEELRDFFFLDCNKSKRVVKSNTCFSITEMKNFLEKLRDFFFSIAIYGYMAIKVFVFIFLPRTCKCMIGGLLGIGKEKR